MLYHTYNTYHSYMTTRPRKRNQAKQPEPTPPQPAQPESAPPEPITVDVAFPPRGFTIEVSITHARTHLPDLLDEVRDGLTVYISRYGKRIAAVMPADAGDYLEQLEDDYWGKRAEAVMRGNPEFVPLNEAIASWEAQDA
jgi:prevent-host-death family protein